MADERDKTPVRPGQTAPSADVEDFLRRVQSAPPPRPGGSRGRLIFAMDATASRGPTWDRACQIQAEMFLATAALGGLDVQLVFYRGFGECKASPWVSDASALARKMTAVACLGGQTQIGRVLGHAARECRRQRVNALVFVGDAFEEAIDDVCAQAGELGLLGMPAFMFHEGFDPVARNAFEQIARLTGGACCSFDGSSADQLKALLRAVAVFAAGGMAALEDHGRRHGGEAARLSGQLRALPGRR
ncbi:MAG: VWA domain-containing protein [Alphaproteobacteria bacterium]